jgi:hypothetical protein
VEPIAAPVRSDTEIETVITSLGCQRQYRFSPGCNQAGFRLTLGEEKFKVDREAVRVRDAFAHGRLLTTKELPARLWKFGGSKNDHVNIEFCEELTVDWLRSKSNMIDGERQKVVDCFNARGYEGLR